MELDKKYLHSREEAYSTILDCANIGLWELYVDGTLATMHMDGRTSVVLGLEDAEHTVDFREAVERCHPDDGERIMVELRDLVLHLGKSKMMEFRVWSEETREWRWVRCFGKSYDTGTPGGAFILGSTQDVQDSLAYTGQMNEANERMRIMLDATPLCSNFWDETYKNIDCNLEAAKLFDLPSKQAYLDNFDKLSPEYQPNGRLSSELAEEHIKEAFEKGRVVFHWIHQKLNGEPVPAEVTLVRVNRGEKDIVVGYTRDLREYNKMMADMREANERTQIMLDATPLCCNLWDADFNNIDCNEEAVKLFDLSGKQEYLDRFFELSPARQPNGRPSPVMAQGYIKEAFANGRVVFRWMHQKLDGTPIPAEITLVRVKRGDGYIVAGYTRDMREYEKMIAATKEANERTQIMLDATPLCCNLWDERFNNIDCNEEAAKLFDLPSKQVYLDNFDKLSPPFQPDGQPSGEKAIGYITEAFEKGRVVFHWMHQKLDGEPVPSEITLVRVKQGNKDIVAGYTRDLREYEKMMAETNEANERTQIMLDATPLCCNMWDENFNNVDCNEEAVKLFELSSKKEYLDRFFELSPERQPNGRPSGQMAAEYIRQAFKGGRVVFEWMHQKLDGTPIPAEITLVRVKRGEKYLVTGYTRDMREYRKMMGEIRQVEADLRLARDAAEESARSKSEFLANMSHEIRTPMNAILGMLHLISENAHDNLTPKQADYLTKTEQSAKTLLRIINDILDFSKIEAGKLEMENVSFTLADVLRQMTDMFGQDIANKGLEFKIDAPKSLPATLRGDPLRLAQVLMNLISNAIKFTEKGGITLAVEENARMDNRALLQFSIKDTGIGMDTEQINRLFTPFTQADTSTTRKYGGTGLGLAISKKLVNLMHGDIWCNSVPSEGSEFILTAEFEVLDGSEAAEALAGARKEAARDDGMAAPGIKPILLAEDNEINQIIAMELLGMKGYHVDVASNGQEAIDKLLLGDYALVLMDIQMPVMDGISAATEIRKLPQYRNLPIIAMTAHAMSGDYEKSIEAGMNDHVTKPIEPEILYETLRKWLAPKKA